MKTSKRKKNAVRQGTPTIVEWLNWEPCEDTPDQSAQIARGEEPSDGDYVEYDPELPPAIYDDDPQAAVGCRDRLRRFADTWMEAKFDIGRWSCLADLQRGLTGRVPTILPEHEGRPPHLYLRTPNFEDPKRKGRAVADWLFYEFVTSPDFNKLGRCVRSSCGKYFIGQRKREKLSYCSAKCGRGDTSNRAHEEEYKKIKDENLEAVRKAIAELRAMSHSTRLRFGNNWKKQASEISQVSLAFITRAVNAGELYPPRDLIL